MIVTDSHIHRQRLRDTLREDLPYAFAVFVLGCCIGTALFAWSTVEGAIQWWLQ